jgi:hypothetical protein
MKNDETGWIEADVIINDMRLSFAEAMTLRVAISSFRMFVNNPEARRGLGPVAEGYETHLQTIESMLMRTP